MRSIITPLTALTAIALSAGTLLAFQPGKTTPENPRQPDAAPPAAPAKPGTSSEQKEEFVFVTLSTSKGDIVLELNKTKAPISVENFVKYVQDGHYDGTIFHRVIGTFMIQGGGMDTDMNEKPTGKGIKNEWRNGLSNARGTVAMARTNDPNSATAQFFINVVDNPRLDGTEARAGYAVFGKVVSGMDVVDQIKAVKTHDVPPHQNVPVDPITLNKARVLTADEAAKFAGNK